MQALLTEEVSGQVSTSSIEAEDPGCVLVFWVTCFPLEIPPRVRRPETGEATVTEVQGKLYLAKAGSYE